MMSMNLYKIDSASRGSGFIERDEAMIPNTIF